MKEYVRSGGHWSIGTDSHIGLNPLEEFRMLTYRQRLVTHHRIRLTRMGGLFNSPAVESGERRWVEFRGSFCFGQPMDAVVYDARTPLLVNTSPEHILGTLVYSTHSAEVWVPLWTEMDVKINDTFPEQRYDPIFEAIR